MGYVVPCEWPQILPILLRLSPGTPVSIWFDSSGFIPTYFQFLHENQAVFSGGRLGEGLTYVKASEIRAIKIGGSFSK